MTKLIAAFPRLAGLGNKRYIVRAEHIVAFIEHGGAQFHGRMVLRSGPFPIPHRLRPGALNGSRVAIKRSPRNAEGDAGGAGQAQQRSHLFEHQ